MTIRLNQATFSERLLSNVLTNELVGVDPLNVPIVITLAPSVEEI